MPRRRTVAIAPTIDILDVRLLDLFAEVEALLRHGRTAQREAIKLRGTSAPLSPRERRALITRIRTAVRHIEREYDELRSVVREVADAADALHTSNSTRRNSR